MKKSMLSICILLGCFALWAILKWIVIDRFFPPTSVTFVVIRIVIAIILGILVSVIVRSVKKAGKKNASENK